MLERLDAAMARSQEAREDEHERQDEESALWRQRTQETLKAIRDEALSKLTESRVVTEYDLLRRTVLSRRRSGRSFCIRPRTERTSVGRHASPRRPRDEPVRARMAPREACGSFGAAQRCVEWWPAGPASFVCLFLC